MSQCRPPFETEPPPGLTWQFDPSVSVGYAYDAGDTIAFNSVSGANLLGVTRMDLNIPAAYGIFVGGELPVQVTDRLEFMLDGRWVFFGTGQTAFETYNATPGIHRDWNVDGRSLDTVNLLMSYSVLKDAGALKDVSPVVGFRWDRYDLGTNNPDNTVNVASVPTNTIDYTTNSYAPVFGVTATFEGLRSGNFGGDVKLGVYGSPWIWGDMSYLEDFSSTYSIGFDANAIRGSFDTVKGETTLFSGAIASGRHATLALTAQYTHFDLHDTARGTAYIGGAVVSRANFKYDASPDFAAIGLKANISF